MKQILLLAALLMSLSSFAQSDFDISKDKENGAIVYKGQISFDDLNKEHTFTWMKKSDEYKPDSATMVSLKKDLPKYEMVVLMGTWCDDSHILIPRLYKVMQQAGYPMAKCKIYGVDRAKETKYIEHKLYSVQKVPTIILFKDHSEVGRIVESVKKSIEADLAQLIQKSKDDAERGQ